jgi:predicted Zn finger-like uncharacterized protein
MRKTRFLLFILLFLLSGCSEISRWEYETDQANDWVGGTTSTYLFIGTTVLFLIIVFIASQAQKNNQRATQTISHNCSNCGKEFFINEAQSKFLHDGGKIKCPHCNLDSKVKNSELKEQQEKKIVVNDRVQKLQEAAQLLNYELITKEEYEKLKDEILKS